MFPVPLTLRDLAGVSEKHVLKCGCEEFSTGARSLSLQSSRDGFERMKPSFPPGNKLCAAALPVLDWGSELGSMSCVVALIRRSRRFGFLIALLGHAFAVNRVVGAVFGCGVLNPVWSGHSRVRMWRCWGAALPYPGLLARAFCAKRCGLSARQLPHRLIQSSERERHHAVVHQLPQ